MNNARIRGEFSTHSEHKPELCSGLDCSATWRCVDCCGVDADRDVLECVLCGRQKSVRCNFDEDMS